MASKRRLRRCVLWISALLFLLVLLLLTSPLWFPWLLRPLAHRYNADFSNYERVGYDRLVVKNLTFRKETTVFTASRVAAVQPLAWGWKYLTHSDAGPRLLVSDWKLELLPSAKTNHQSHSLPFLFDQAKNSVPRVEQWLPAATLTNGVVLWNTNEVQVPFVIWRDGTLSGQATVTRFNQTAKWDIDASKREAIQLHLQLPDLETATTLRITKTNDAIRVAGDIQWLTNTASITATFTRESFLPVFAKMETPAFNIPAANLHLTNYHDVEGSFAAEWTGTNFSVDLTANAASLMRGFPPLHAVVQAHGDTNFVRLHKVSLSLPGATADLSRNVDVSFKGRLLSETAEFKVAADLSQQSFIAATGTVSGQIFLRRNETIYPDATFQIKGSDLVYSNYSSKAMIAEGSFAWPEVTLNNFSVDVSDSAHAMGKAVVDLQKRSVESSSFKMEGTVPKEMVPSKIGMGHISLMGSCNGPIGNIAYAGELSIPDLLLLPSLRPVKLKAKYSGRRKNLESFDATLSTAESELHLSGAALVETNNISIKLAELSLTTNQTPAFSLTQPSQIDFQKQGSSAWHVAISPFQLHGIAGDLSLTGNAEWPSKGNVALAGKGLNSKILQAFVTNAFPAIAVSTLRFSGGWTNSPLNFSLEGDGTYKPPEELPLRIQIKAVGNKEGMQFDELLVWSDSKTILNAHGDLPARLEPSRKEKIIQVDGDAPFKFQAITKPNEAFWDRITKLAKLKLDGPEISLNVSGTLNKPVAQLSATARSLDWQGANRPLPKVSELRANLKADQKTLSLTQLSFKVEGQPVMVSAEMPLVNLTNKWREAFDWQKARGRIVVKEAQVSPFLPYLPSVLGPSGSIDLDVTMSPGRRVNGDLQLRNIETRSLGTVGSVHNLRAHLRFTESLVQFTNVTGVLGGETVGVSGFINFAEMGKDNLPLFDLNVAGKGVPLTRKPDLILRADIELNALNTRTNEQPLVSGLVNFNESFFLGDLKMLLPGKVAKPRERPPFFSVEAEPFSKWNLNVRLAGENFMRVRTPLFRGAISANWRLRGTLREPMALGDAKIESGQVQFPFSNLRVQQGFVTLTSEDPYRPQIFATAASRTFGYDVQMTLTGPADKPLVEFSSTPPLTSEQIVLMLTAGELPKREASFSAEKRAGRLALFLGKSVLSKFTSDNGGAERLIITSGENITEQGKETYALEYKITDDISLVGEYDRFGAWNAGVKWRVYSK